MNRVIRFSYIFFFSTLIAVGYLKMATPFLTVLFSYLVLRNLRLSDRKHIPIAIFIIIVSGVFYGFVHFIGAAREALPKIIEESLPKVIDYAKTEGWDLPFSDLESLKELGLRAVREELGYLAGFASIASREFVLLIIGLVIAAAIYINGTLDLDHGKYPIKNNLYSLFCAQLAERFYGFYLSFETVMGAQIIISAINTCATSIFVLSTHLPYKMVVVVLTFLCGLLPIIGNIISNTIITGIALTKSLNLAIVALVFLILVHKVEYFLNSKIIGGRIKNPMWLTLISLVVGERAMGIPGMILAPVLLNYIKREASQIEVAVISRSL